MKQDINQEIKWHEENPWIKKNHFLMKWPFVSTKRHHYAYKYARKNVKKIILSYIKSRSKKEKIIKCLVAPCGTNADQDILKGIAEKFYGIDVSPVAVEKCSKMISAKVGNILNSGYKNAYFDLVSSLLFFHHLHRVGFTPFIKEFHRILKKQGILVILEPSVFFPLYWLMFLGRKVFGNITGLVPDEAPIIPSKLRSELIAAGFSVESIESVSFSHNRIPLPIQYAINILSIPFRRLFPFSHMGWMTLFICSKQ